MRRYEKKENNELFFAAHVGWFDYVSILSNLSILFWWEWRKPVTTVPVMQSLRFRSGDLKIYSASSLLHLKLRSLSRCCAAEHAHVIHTWCWSICLECWIRGLLRVINLPKNRLKSTKYPNNIFMKQIILLF